MIESCGWDRKRTFFFGKVLLPIETSPKENVRETNYHRATDQGNERNHNGAGGANSRGSQEDAAGGIGSRDSRASCEVSWS